MSKNREDKIIAVICLIVGLFVIIGITYWSTTPSKSDIEEHAKNLINESINENGLDFTCTRTVLGRKLPPQNADERYELEIHVGSPVRIFHGVVEVTSVSNFFERIFDGNQYWVEVECDPMMELIQRGR